MAALQRSRSACAVEHEHASERSAHLALLALAFGQQQQLLAALL